MAEWSVTHTLTTPGPDITFTNTGTGDEYIIDPAQSRGLDGAPRRKPVDDVPGGDGGIVFAGRKKARPIFVLGLLMCRTGTATARNTMEANLYDALEAIDAADGTWQWTPAGQSSRTLTVQQEIAVEFQSVANFPMLKTFSFGLIAANPDWV